MEFSYQYRTSFLIVLLLVFGSSVCFSTVGPLDQADRIAAVVGDQMVTLAEVKWFVAYRNFSVPDEPEERIRFYRSILDQLINIRLVQRESSRTPLIQVTEAEVSRFQEAYQARFETEEAFQRKLEEMGASAADFRRLIRAQVAVNKFIDLRFEPFVIVLPNEIQQYYEDEYAAELRANGQPVPDLSLVEGNIRQLLSNRKTTAQLESWIDAARSRVRVRVLLFREPTGAPNLPPSLVKEIRIEEAEFSKGPSSNRRSPSPDRR